MQAASSIKRILHFYCYNSKTSCDWWAVDIRINLSSLKKKKKKKIPHFSTVLSHIGSLFTYVFHFQGKCFVSLFCSFVLFCSIQLFFIQCQHFDYFSHVMFIVCIASNIKIYFSHKTSAEKFYIRGSVLHRNSRSKKSNEMQQYADIYLLLNYCTFRASIAPVVWST